MDQFIRALYRWIGNAYLDDFILLHRPTQFQKRNHAIFGLGR